MYKLIIKSYFEPWITRKILVPAFLTFGTGSLLVNYYFGDAKRSLKKNPSSSGKKLDKKVEDMKICHALGALRLKDWFEAIRSYHLTIEDLLKMKPGEKLEVVFLHRNFCDEIYNKFHQGKSNQVYDPAVFLKDLVEKFKYKGDMKWEMPYDDYIHIDSSRYGLPMWYPLNKEGKIKIEEDEIKCLGISHTLTDSERKKLEVVGKHWDSYPVQSEVGYRGPMIRASDLHKLPKLMGPKDF